MFWSGSGQSSLNWQLSPFPGDLGKVGAAKTDERQCGFTLEVLLFFQNIFELIFNLPGETLLANLNLFGVDLIITKSIIWNQIRLSSRVMIFPPQELSQKAH